MSCSWPPTKYIGLSIRNGIPQAFMETFKPTDDEVFEKQYRIIHMYHHSSDAGLGTPAVI